jgi:hypothetical protein
MNTTNKIRQDIAISNAPVNQRNYIESYFNGSWNLYYMKGFQIYLGYIQDIAEPLSCLKPLS